MHEIRVKVPQGVGAEVAGVALSHVTPSYLGRAFAAAVLLAYGMMDDNAVAIVVAALFLPFLSVVLAISFGAWAEDFRLARQGAVQYAVFPVWVGVAIVLGFPDRAATMERLLTLGINIVTIAGGAAATYAVLGMRRSEVHRFVKSRFWGAE